MSPPRVQLPSVGLVAGSALLAGCLLACLAGPAVAAERHRLVLPPGLEDRFESLLGPQAQAAGLPGGWKPGDILIEASQVRYRLERDGAQITLVLRAPTEAAASNSRNFSIALSDPADAIPAAEEEALLRELVALIRENDTGPSPWKTVELDETSAAPAHGDPPAAAPPRSPWVDVANPTRQLQALMLLVLLGVALRAHRLFALLRAVGPRDSAWLAAATLLGLSLRLLVGPRVPAWIYNHGYELLDQVLLHPLASADPHGNTYDALHGLVTSVLPGTEGTLLATQVALSTACIPLVYGVGRAWLGERGPALWAAVVAAVLPVPVAFAASEVRLVSGAFFLLASLAALGWCVRDAHPIPRFVAAGLAVIATQAYPTLMVAPVVLAVFIWTAPDARSMLAQPWSWVAALLGLGLYAIGASRVLSMLAGGTGIHGPQYLHTLGLLPRTILPTWTFAQEACNTWLNHHYTPPVLWLCSLGAVVAGALRRLPRGPVLAIAASALLLTAVNLIDGRMNTARVQLPAQALYCLLAGAGLHLARGWLTGLWSRVARGPGATRRGGPALASALLVCLVAASAVAWPGPIGLVSAPQRQHRFITRALEEIDPACTILLPAGGSSPIGRVPRYLRDASGRRRVWHALPEIDLRKRMMRGDCLIYFRPVDCYDRGAPGAGPVAEGGLLEVCAAAERGLRLRPLHTASIEAVIDNQQEYTRARLPIGFYTITP